MARSSRQYLGWGPCNPGMVRGLEQLEKQPPNRAYRNMHYYYATQMAHHMGGQAWKVWNPKMRDLLTDLQDKGTDPEHCHQKGSWSPVNWDGNGSNGAS